MQWSLSGLPILSIGFAAFAVSKYEFSRKSQISTDEVSWLETKRQVLFRILHNSRVYNLNRGCFDVDWMFNIYIYVHI